MSSPDDGARLHELLDELRATAPPAPERLRNRIEQVAAGEPVHRTKLRDRLSLRRAALALAPAVLAVALGIAAVGALTDPGRDAHEAASAGATTVAQPTAASLERKFNVERRRQPAPLDAWTASRAADRERLTGAGASAVPPAQQRAQQYHAALRLRVATLDALSRRTQQAIRATRGWGGYVVSVDYNIPAREGDARLVLRVPVQRVQRAVQLFSELGTILAQDVSIRDVQGRLDRYTREILARRERIAKLRAQLAQPGRSEAERRTLEVRIARAQRRIAALRAERAGLARQARFATVSLTLTTRDPAAVSEEDEGRIEAAVRDAGGILAKELAFALYALIVAAPFLALAAAALLAGRATRRRADERLLERA